MTTKNKIINIFVLCLVIIILFAALNLIDRPNQEIKNINTSNINSNLNNESIIHVKNIQNSLTTLGDIWSLYTNNNLGFSIEIPKKLNNEMLIPIEKGNSVKIGDWEILIKTVSNDTQLESFIKEKYGEVCKLGNKNKTSQPDVYDVTINDRDWDRNMDSLLWTEENSCFVNYITVIKYFPKKNKLASWDMGQGPSFYLPNGEAVDGRMLESFKFLQ